MEEQEQNNTRTSRNWVFTLNNPTEVLIFGEEKVRYAIWQKEIGENGTPHYQGYIELKRNQRLAAMKKLIPGAHFEQRRGTREQARDYSRKEETRAEGPWEFGTWDEGGQGSRTDLQDVKRMLDEGKPLLSVAEEHFSTFLRYERGLQSYKRLKQSDRKGKTEVDLYLGSPGVGKSYRAAEEATGGYWKSPDKWWDGYEQQRVVVIDDFSGWLQWTQLLHILDAYPCDVEAKGTKLKFNSARIIITSNYHPDDWYSKEGTKRPIDALMRRIDRIWIFTARAVYKAPGASWQQRADWLRNKWYGGLDLNIPPI